MSRGSVCNVCANIKCADLVLIGNAQLDYIKRQNRFLNLDHNKDINWLLWWIPAVPAYLFANGPIATDIRPNLIQLLSLMATSMVDATLPRVTLAAPLTGTTSNFAFTENNTMLLLAAYTWKEGFEFLSQEIEYFWEQAIRGPNVDDFSRLKASRKFAEQLYRDLGLWITHAGTDILLPGRERIRNEVHDLREQTLNMKQEISDTFQLLIGAINIKDSEIQKKLARDSKKQARRSTALTALAAIYLPLSLTTGVFGMNISEINAGSAPNYWAVLALAFGLLFATLPFLLWIFFDKDDDDDISEGRRKSIGSHHGSRIDSFDREKHAISRRSTALKAVARPHDSLRQRKPTSPRASQDGSQKGRHSVANPTAQPEHMV